jgi:hypothetical protein
MRVEMRKAVRNDAIQNPTNLVVLHFDLVYGVAA